MNFSRVGSATPSPKASTSRVPSDGTKASRFAAASDTAERTIAWSRSFAMRIANRVEHCEMMVESSSAGRCVTSPRNTPYLRPSLAMRESALRVGPKPIAAVGRGVAVRFLAHEQERERAVAPHAEIERHPAEHRHHRVDDLGREARELHDGHRLAVRRQAEQLAQRLAHRVAADVRVVEHEGVARIVAHRFDARDQLVIDHARGAVLELAHALVDQRDQVGEAIRHRGVDRVAGGLRVVALEHRRARPSGSCCV